VVHAGIDSGNVVYTEDELGDGVQPTLDNVGLLNAYRHALDPRDYLDPRCAAQEHFDSQHGRIDHATDIYRLGMVVYRLLAGRHPLDGSYGDIREGVLEERPPPPSECPPAPRSAVDEVVAKATAKQKLTRYETAHGLHQDISRIRDAVLD
jgi:serine/threonine protein kinase